MAGFFRRDRRQINRENQEQGRRGEERVRMRRELQGWKMTRTGKGHDYKATRTDQRTGRKKTEYVEVKTGDAKLSPLQKKKKRQYGRRYVVENGDSMCDINPKHIRKSSNKFRAKSYSGSHANRGSKKRRHHLASKQAHPPIRKNTRNIQSKRTSNKKTPHRKPSAKNSAKKSIFDWLLGRNADKPYAGRHSKNPDVRKKRERSTISRLLWGNSDRSITTKTKKSDSKKPIGDLFWGSSRNTSDSLWGSQRSNRDSIDEQLWGSGGSSDSLWGGSKRSDQSIDEQLWGSGGSRRRSSDSLWFL